MIATTIVFLIAGTFFLFAAKQGSDPAEDLQEQTIAVTGAYYEAQIFTYKVLHVDSTVDYNTWYRGMEKACALWEEVAYQSKRLEAVCDAVLEETDPSLQDLAATVGNFFETRTAYAYTQKEINAVFDAAPAGKKIKTLAGYLGTDAKTAYNILKGTQAEIAKEAYAQADFYQKCETAAVVIKDTAKVGFFAGSIALSGGTAATFGLLDGACTIAAGTDLLLEIYENGATIAYGEGNATTAVIQDLRKGSKPLAAILGLSSLTSHAIDQLAYISDSTLSLFQSDEVLGFNIKSSDTGTIELTGMDYADVAYWASANDIDLEITATQDLTLTAADVQNVDIAAPGESVLASAQTSASGPSETTSGFDLPDNNFDLELYLIGTWQSIDYWGGDYLDEDGHYIDYTADNNGYTYIMTIVDGYLSIDERNDNTGTIADNVWAYNYVVDGPRVDLYTQEDYQFTFYYNPDDQMLYCVKLETLRTNGTYRVFYKISE